MHIEDEKVSIGDTDESVCKCKPWLILLMMMEETGEVILGCSLHVTVPNLT